MASLRVVTSSISVAVGMSYETEIAVSIAGPAGASLMTTSALPNQSLWFARLTFT